MTNQQAISLNSLIVVSLSSSVGFLTENLRYFSVVFFAVTGLSALAWLLVLSDPPKKLTFKPAFFLSLIMALSAGLAAGSFFGSWSLFLGASLLLTSVETAFWMCYLSEPPKGNR